MGRMAMAMIMIVIWACAGGAAVASGFISEGALVSSMPRSRTLLQAKTNCPISFEFMNYTVLTSECKGPRYPPELCCPAFVKFACPYADVLNDPTNTCASTMFSYINLNGNYPAGLFANTCVGSKRGLECNQVNSTASGQGNNISASPALTASLTFISAVIPLWLLFVFY
ncbi:GPI-anchored protein LLG2-like [Wolffia australiana]